MSYKEGKIYLKHDDESDEAYSWFVNYILQTNNDSVLGAYKEYLSKEKRKSATYVSNIKSVPIKYTNWSNGCDNVGNKIEGLHTFSERLDAFRKTSVDNKLEKIKLQRQKVTESEYQHSQSLLVLWEELFDDLLEHRRLLKEEMESNNEKYNGINDLNKLKDLVRVRDEIAKLERRSVGMLTDIKEDLFSNELKEDKEDSIKWVELPDVSKKFDDDNEIDSMTEAEFVAYLENENLIND